jgi:hypothetical protein
MRRKREEGEEGRREGVRGDRRERGRGSERGRPFLLAIPYKLQGYILKTDPIITLFA